MASIGSFGAARREATDSAELDTFEYLGETFRVARRVGAAATFDYAEAVVGEIDMKDLRAAVAVKAMLRAAVYPEDWARFWTLFEAQNGDFEELAELSAALYGHVSDRPTGRPSDSIGGPPQTGNGSNGVAVHQEAPVLALPDGTGGYTPIHQGVPVPTPTT